MEATDPKSTETANADSGTEAREPDSSATSSDTLSEIEQSEKVSTPAESGEHSSGGAGNNAPSPDGQFDDSRGQDRDVNDPGPM